MCVAIDKGAQKEHKSSKSNVHKLLPVRTLLLRKWFNQHGHVLALVLVGNGHAHGQVVAPAADADVGLFHLHHLVILVGDDQGSLDSGLTPDQGRLVAVELRQRTRQCYPL